MNLLAALVDDAGLFPPESLPMADALARHRSDGAAGRPMLSGRFLCPAGRLGELRASPALAGWSGEPPQRLANRGVDRRLHLSLILDTGLDGLAGAVAEIADEPRLALEMIEVPAPAEDDVAAALGALVGFEPAAFLEGPRSTEWIKTVGAWSRPGGLRGAVRHRDAATGFVHHGFLNLVVAAVRAASRASVDEVAAVLASTDGGALAADARAVSGRELLVSRALFRGYGSCSTSEPLEEAARLGLLGAA